MATTENTFGGNYYAVSGSVTIGIWRKVGSAWTMFTTEEVTVYEITGSGGTQTVAWDMLGTYNMGPGVTDIGITIEAQTGSAAALNNLDVSYSASASSGERSASPGGERATATVRPQ